MAIGSLALRVGANTKPFNDAMRQTKKPAQDLRGEMARMGKRAAMLTTALAGAGLAITANLTRKGLDSIDAQAKLSRQLDGTIDGVRGLRIAAEDAGVSAGVMDSAMERLNSRIGEAQRGTGQALESFNRLGLSAEELGGMDVDERMATIADRMQEMGLSGAQAADELRQMGIRQGEIVGLMQQGGDAIRAARQEVDDYGLSVSEVDAAKVEAANDAFDRVGRTMEVIQNQLAIKLAPIIEGIAKLFTDSAKEAGGIGDAVGNAVDMGVSAFAFMADAVEGVRRAFVITGQAIATFALALKRDMVAAAAGIISGPVDAINALIRTANLVPGINFGEVEQPDIVTGLQEQLDAAHANVREGKAAMNRTLMEPMPSEGIKQWVSDTQDAAEDAAKATAEGRDRQQQILDMASEGDDEEADKERERMREKMQARIEELQFGLLNEKEQEEHAHAEQMEFLRNALEEELLTKAEFEELEQEQAREHQERLSKILADGEKDRSDEIGRFARANQAIRESGLAQETAELRSGLQTMFGDHKAFGEALGNLKRIEAVMSAYSWGASIGGPPAGAAAAGLAAGAQMASMNDMKSASFSGGSSQPAAGSTSAPVQGGGGGGPEGGTLTVQGLSAGSLFSGAVVGELAEELLDYQRRGGSVVLS